MVELNLKNIYKKYPNSEHYSVEDFNLDIKDKEFIVFVGPSGCGKSTTLRMIAGLEDITEGTASIDGVVVNDVAPKDRDIAMVFQNYALYPHMTVYDNMAFGLKLRKYSKEDIDKRVQEAAEILGLKEFLERKPADLSGGQRQRIGIARALVMQPDFVIADEPISALDVSVRAQVLNLLKKFQKELGLTYLFIAHDLSVVRFISDRIAVIYKGVIVEVAETEELFNNPIHPYTQALLSAVPIPDPILERKKVLKVYDPSQHDYETDKPSMVEIRPGHYVWANQAELARYQQGLN